MQYVSTRTKDAERVSAAYAIKTGLAPDGGLFMPEAIPAIALSELAETAAENGYSVFAVMISDPDFDLGTQKKPSKQLDALSKG